MTNLIQWNCRGYRSRYEDLCRILSTHNPAIVLLQETMLDKDPHRPPKGYNIYCDFNEPIPGKGLGSLIRKDISHMKIDLNTRLQASAFRIGLRRSYTICNIYMSPNSHVQLNEITNLIDQLPAPTIICGDFNCRHELWDDQYDGSDARAGVVEAMLLSSAMTVLNSGEATHFHLQTASSSAIDLSICTSNVATRFNWSVLDDLYGSDHFPLIVQEIQDEAHIAEQRFQEFRADWTAYERETLIPNLEDTLDQHTVDELVEQYNSIIITAANKTIPKSNIGTRSKKVPWWTPECTEAINQRKFALRKYQRSRLVTDKISYCRARAYAKQTLASAKRESWRKYVHSLNHTTPMAKVWQRIQKIQGKYTNIRTPCLIKNNATITDHAQVAKFMAQHYQRIGSNQSYSRKFQRIRAREERPLNFNTAIDHEYNRPLTYNELMRMLSISQNTAPGEDQITYNMIRKTHISCKKLLLAIMNKIYSTGRYPSQWRSSVILSFPKPGKDLTMEENYRPISLTSSVGKLMEKIVNCRLTAFLESNQLLPSKQYGFRKMTSTTDALMRFTSDISAALNNKQHMLCVSFDLKKPMTRHGNITSREICIAVAYAETYQSTSRTSYQTEASKQKSRM